MQGDDLLYPKSYILRQLRYRLRPEGPAADTCIIDLRQIPYELLGIRYRRAEDIAADLIHQPRTGGSFFGDIICLHT